MIYETRETQHGIRGYKCTASTTETGKATVRFFPHTRQGEYDHVVFREAHRDMTGNGRKKYKKAVTVSTVEG